MSNHAVKWFSNRLSKIPHTYTHKQLYTYKFSWQLTVIFRFTIIAFLFSSFFPWLLLFLVKFSVNLVLHMNVSFLFITTTLQNLNQDFHPLKQITSIQEYSDVLHTLFFQISSYQIFILHFLAETSQ